MKITQECDYAMRIMLLLFANGPTAKEDAKAIASTQKIPFRFTVKILRKLLQAGLIRSYKGAFGGYGILQQPGEITMLEVIEAIDGPILINRCMFSGTPCTRIENKDYCPIHLELEKLQEHIRHELSKISFEKLTKSEQ
ncbi:MAG: Rrf2 family transcriptional regulator [Hyphomonadaceae bacterium]|nr:Rrf2 family transcriptional regulator [Clostridia bacterium]